MCLQGSEIACKTATDPGLKELLLAIQTNFLSDFSEATPTGPYLPFPDGSYIHDSAILYDDRVVVPLSLRSKVLSILHGAHQGVSAIERRARSIVFWPVMINDIHEVRNSCVYCNCYAPCQAATIPLPSNPPATPFEKIFFNYGAHHFLVTGDRFYGWADVFGTPSGTNVAGQLR